MSKRIMVVFGGNSSESEISVITGVEAIAAMPGKGYYCIPVYIHGRKWYTGEDLYNINSFRHFNPKFFTEVRLMGKALYRLNRFGSIKKFSDVDAAILCTHGGDGEDGTLQGFLELNEVPFSSPDTAGASLTMDKLSTKHAVKGLGIPVVQGRAVTLPITDAKLELLEELYNYPMIVKPISSGSSIGITFAGSREELKNGLELAFTFGGRVLVERGLRNFTEANCAAFRMNGEVILSQIEKPITQNAFLTFADKYESGKKGMTDASREFPAKLPPEIENKIKNYTRTAYDLLSLKGIVRVDYLIEGDEVFLNEINAIPGSLAHYLFQDFSYTSLLKVLIEETLRFGLPERHTLSTQILANAKPFTHK